ncbi:MAG: metal-dependent transcriptional regulator [Archaeoglobaceae archaeon]
MRTEFVLRKVYEIWEKEGIVGPSRLAEVLNISKSTAHRLLSSISSAGYGRYIERKGLILNRNGIEAAKKAIRKHRLIECLLHDIGVSDVCGEAERIETSAGRELLRTLEEKYGNRRLCPCGKEIPR